mmetsp:Transcript_15869/g.36736  ORF Transcript_15869/g.36736 Transcript_15869/m.36736 type:complete len:153 (+) Transcript_15869:1017-1475(+)
MAVLLALSSAPPRGTETKKATGFFLLLLIFAVFGEISSIETAAVGVRIRSAVAGRSAAGNTAKSSNIHVWRKEVGLSRLKFVIVSSIGFTICYFKVGRAITVSEVLFLVGQFPSYCRYQCAQYRYVSPNVECRISNIKYPFLVETVVLDRSI